MTKPRYLLFLHGIKNDDPSRAWLDALNQALRREGTLTVEERGYRVIAPAYLDLLESEAEPDGERPPETYKRQDDDVLRRAAARYWLTLDSLNRSGIRQHEAAPSALARIPAEGVHADLLRDLGFPDANRYRRSAARRHAVLRRICNALPDVGELVIIAHSLGTVIARDLIYHLPSELRLRLMITIGTPLAFKPMREHLEDRHRRFPYEIMGPWINIVGAGDMVTGFRGLSQIYGQALDLFVDTGRLREAHRASAYLEHAIGAIALEWLDEHQPPPAEDRPPPDRPLPAAVLSLIVGAQYSLRTERALKAGERRSRFAEARQLVLASLAKQIADAGFEHVTAGQLARNNRTWLRSKTIGDEEVIAYLLSAVTSNPINPYEIDLAREARVEALKELATDLGRPERFASIADEAERAARAIHKDRKLVFRRAALAVAGIAVVIAAPVLVLAAAPAGLAGGAALVAGLAALGPGGMLGGVGIVSLLGGTGGLAIGRALLAGTAAQVEETVIFLQALAKARYELRAADLSQTTKTHPEWYALIEMEDVAADELERLSLFSDADASVVKELQRKLRTVDRALEWLRAEGLSPDALPAGTEDEG